METLLLKEEVEKTKLVNKEFQVQNSTKFEFPCLNLDFEKFKQVLSYIRIMAKSE